LAIDHCSVLSGIQAASRSHITTTSGKHDLPSSGPPVTYQRTAAAAAAPQTKHHSSAYFAPTASKGILACILHVY